MAIKTESNGSNWTFLTNHSHVLLCIVKNKNLRLRDISKLVGITERRTQSIITDLSNDGYIDIRRDGRCNSYTVHPEKDLRHTIEAHRKVSDLIRLIENEVDNNEK